MPKTSERQRFLRELHDVLAIAILEEDDEEDLEELSLEQFLDSDLDDTAELLLLVHSNRYLTDRVRLPKTTEFLQDSFRESIFGTTFRSMARMDKASFFRVVTLIQDNPVFLNRSTCPQAPAWIVTLDRFGNNGTGASLNRSRRLWGLGKGTVDDFLPSLSLIVSINMQRSSCKVSSSPEA
ncbi:hypothetical protein DVH05_000918 [Phytophthora capsici]|nr:hypothetical protein DVH05_000918 [Phytophthora capsici]